MGSEKAIVSKRTAKLILERVYTENVLVAPKTAREVSAMEVGARVLERAVEAGKDCVHEAAILRYHAQKPDAHIFTDEYTRKAILAAIVELNRIEREE